MDYDVIVCGAGPSGATCAKFIADNGYKVALLDKSNFPRDKPCGGALRLSIDEHKYVMEGMKDIELTASTEVRMHSPSGKHQVKFRSKDPLMLHIRRSEFDAMLVEHAVDAGAELLEKHQVKKVIVSKGKATVTLKDTKQLSSHLVVGAGGVRDPVAGYLRKKHGLALKWRKSQLAYLVTKEYTAGERFIEKTFGQGRTSHIFLKPSGVYGYGWLFPKRDVLNVGFGAFWKDMKKIDIHSEFAAFLKSVKKKKLLPKETKMGKLTAAELPMAGPIKRTYSDRIVVVGDAAGFVSPLVGDGLYYAVSSGRFAAEVLVKALRKKRYDGDHLKGYQDRWKTAWGREIRTLKMMSRSVNKQPERFIRYVSLDEKLRRKVQGVLTGRKDPKKEMWRMGSRILLDFFRYF